MKHRQGSLDCDKDVTIHTNKTCQYEVWNKKEKCLEHCGKPAQLWSGMNCPSAWLCDEHGEFMADAFTGRRE